LRKFSQAGVDSSAFDLSRLCAKYLAAQFAFSDEAQRQVWYQNGPIVPWLSALQPRQRSRFGDPCVLCCDCEHIQGRQRLVINR